MAAIFISYRRSDTAYMSDIVYESFRRRFWGTTIFRDVEEITPGLDFPSVIADALSSCVVMLVIIGKDWLSVRDVEGNRRMDDEADFVRMEVEQALKRGIPVIPVLVGGAEMPAEEGLPPAMRPLCHRNAARLRPAPDFQADLRRLGNAVEEHLKRVGVRRTRVLQDIFLSFPMESRVARQARGVFYVLSLFGLIALSDMLMTQTMSEDLFGPGDRWEVWAGGAVFFAMAVLARHFAVTVEKGQAT